MKRWFGEFGCWISQGVNMLICIKGATADETISSRIGKYKTQNGGDVPYGKEWPLPLFWATHAVLSKVPFLKGHFINAIENDEGVTK